MSADPKHQAPAPVEPGAPSSSHASMPLNRLLGWVALGLIVAAVAAGTWVKREMRKSLPLLDGSYSIAGLERSVRVERDELGIPTVHAESRHDVARAVGFLHGQDRFFQMDLSRRQAAGELAALVGKAALPLDRRHRVHRFRSRAIEGVQQLPADQRALLEAYSEGVNQGLAQLEKPPFEYLVLRTTPTPWKSEDVFLVALAMYFELNDENGTRDAMRGLVLETLGQEMFDFLLPWGTEWDAPLDGSQVPHSRLPGRTPDLQQIAQAAPRADPPTQHESSRWHRYPSDPRQQQFLGSNNWAVAGSRTADGRAILANDMHLGLGVPNIWYRAAWTYPDAAGIERTISGVTLPGIPFLIVGSNGFVAWGFTNSYGDWSDLIELELDDTGRYLTPDGPREFERKVETIEFGNADSETLEIEETVWGPVIDHDADDLPRALRWIAHDIGSVNAGLLAIEEAQTLEQALEAANRAASPPQNFVVADNKGQIGWTLLGRIPRRFGYDGRTPTSWSDGSRGWDGWLSPSDYPRIINPPDGLLWTANNRTVGGQELATLGDGGLALGARAQQIHGGLQALEQATERDLLEIQLDDRALFLERWHKLLLELLDEDAVANFPKRNQLRDAAVDWDGHAATDSVSYRIVRRFRSFTANRLLDHLTAAAKARDERFDAGWMAQREGPVWLLVTERPPEYLPHEFANWNEFLLAAVDDVTAELTEGDHKIAHATWGKANRVTIRHPLSQSIPIVGPMLDMRPQSLPGDSFMPRVQGQRFGASQRMVVSPGREELGFFHMPAGQSGHPLSPNYRVGHDAWANGVATPFSSGPAVHTLTLEPVN